MPDLNPQLIKLVASDVDGTLTDGRMIYGPSGEVSKSFNVRDGLGVKLLQTVGVTVSLVSSDDSPVATARAQRLGIDSCRIGVHDKIAAVESLCRDAGIEMKNAAFLGDDLQDYAVMQSVGMGVAVADAHPMVLAIADHVTQRLGGMGAFREFADWLIEQQGHHMEEVWLRSQQ
jgi:3-deoxy-D-manno-octulosonate 8-phosphate phosphatase (KDO 8-P phosphatase)